MKDEQLAGAIVHRRTPIDVLPDGMQVGIDADSAHLSVGGCARFQVTAARVIVTPVAGAAPAYVQAVLDGLITAYVLALQGRFALHASVVAIDGRVVALAGRSGAGKSTTSLRLTQLGGRLLIDDVTPLDAELDGRAVATPTGRPLRVWPASLDALGLDRAQAHTFWPGAAKLQLPVAAGGPVAVDAIVVLGTAARPVPLERLDPVAATASLCVHAYRSADVLRLRGAEVLRWAAWVAQAVPVWSVERPDDGWTVDDVVRQVRAALAG